MMMLIIIMRMMMRTQRAIDISFEFKPLKVGLACMSDHESASKFTRLSVAPPQNSKCEYIFVIFVILLTRILLFYKIV